MRKILPYSLLQSGAVSIEEITINDVAIIRTTKGPKLIQIKSD